MNKKIQKVVALSLASMTLLSGCGAKTIPTLENGDLMRMLKSVLPISIIK